MRYLELTESLGPMTPLDERARHYPDLNSFLKSLDSAHFDILYRGHSGEEPTHDAFMTDYVGHAFEYGEHVNAYEYHYEDLMNFDDQQFENMRSEYRRLDLTALYRQCLAGHTFAEEWAKSLKFIKMVINSEIPYSRISQNFGRNDPLVPLMQYYAESKGKNIICFLGGDYAEYGGQNEYVVSDVSKLRDLNKLHREIHKS